MRGHWRITALLLSFVALPALALAARQGRLIGTVVDPEGNPIAGVSVTATCAEIPEFREVLTTDEKGLFKLDVERINVTYRYRFEKDGFLTLQAEQEWLLEGTQRLKFMMQPGQMQAPGGAPLASTSSPAIEAFNAGVRALKAKDDATALAKLQEAAEHDPYLRQAWEALAELHLDAQRYQEAVEAAEKAMALGSRVPQVLRARWEAYRHLGDEAKTAEAQADLEKFGRLTEEAKRIHNEGVGLSKAGDEAGAFAKFQEALEIDPSLEEAQLGVAVTGLKLGRAAEALAAAEGLLDANPQHEEALRLRYNAALELRDEVQVVEALLGLAAIEPEMVRDSVFQLGTAAFDRDQTAKAKERFGSVLELDPDHPRSHYYLGLLYMRESGKDARASARRHLQRFLELAPQDPDAATAAQALEYLKGS